MVLGFVVGPLEFLIFAFVVVLLFGGKRLVGAGRGLGTGLREFRESVRGDQPDEPEELPARRAGPSERDDL